MIDPVFDLRMSLLLSCFFGLTAVESHSSSPPVGFRRLKESKTDDFSSNMGENSATLSGH